MISSANFALLRNGEIIAFISNLLLILSKVDVKKLGLESQTKNLTLSFGVLKDQYKAERGSKITRLIVSLDKDRDMLFVAIRTILIQHAQAHPDESMRPRAEALLETIEKFGEDLYRKSYEEQTVGMYKIIETIDKSDALKTMLEDLSLKEYYEEMKAANKAFDEKYLERNKGYEQGPKEKLQDLRIDAEDRIDKLFQRINAHIVLADEPDSYEKLAAVIDRLVKTYQDAIEKRRVKKEEAKESLDQDFNEVAE